jgi:hypothetical protein
VERLGVVFAREGDDLVLAEGVRLELGHLADPAVLEVGIGRGRPLGQRHVPEIRYRRLLPLGRGACRRRPRIAHAAELIGEPGGHHLALVIAEFDEDLRHAHVGAGGEDALLLCRVEGGEHVARPHGLHPAHLVDAR